VRYFLRPHRHPPVSRILLVESGSRHLIEDLIPNLPPIFGDPLSIDLVTCYAGAPVNLGSGKIYRVMDYASPDLRAALFRELAANDYQVMGIICSGEAVMSKWKWMLTYKVPAKVFMLNENGDYVWLDREHLGTIWEFIRFRSGLAGAGAVRTLARLLLFPFSLLFLIAYATAVHARRGIRMWSMRTWGKT